MDGEADWNKCVDEFDTEKFASQLKEMGAHYLIFTMMQHYDSCAASQRNLRPPHRLQGRRGMLNAIWSKMLYQSLHKRVIRLMLYWTGDEPLDELAAKGMGYTGGTPGDVKNWAAVAASMASDTKIKLTATGWTAAAQAITRKSGRFWPTACALETRRIIALNNPAMNHSIRPPLNDSATTGETNSFGEVPASRWRNGVQWHVLSRFSGTNGARPGSDTARTGWRTTFGIARQGRRSGVDRRLSVPRRHD